MILTLNQWPWYLKLTYILWICQHTKNEVCMSRHSEVTAQTDRQTDRHNWNRKRYQHHPTHVGCKNQWIKINHVQNKKAMRDDEKVFITRFIHMQQVRALKQTTVTRRRRRRDHTQHNQSINQSYNDQLMDWSTLLDQSWNIYVQEQQTPFERLCTPQHKNQAQWLLHTTYSNQSMHSDSYYVVTIYPHIQKI